MNKIMIASLALGMAVGFASCDDDRDDNPTIEKATEFVFNTPTFSGNEIRLSASKALPMSWSQPNWGFPLVAEYELQLSKDGNFTVSAAEAEEDEEGKKVANYVSLDPVSTCKTEYLASDIATGLAHLYRWDDETQVPEDLQVYARVLATPKGSAKQSQYAIASNVVTMKFSPYYVALTAAPTEMWYLVGACIGDGSWGNDAKNIGTAIYPMRAVTGAEYDKKTGQGPLTFTGYLTTEGFKLVKTPGGWDDQWGMKDGALVKNDGGSGNIEVAANGYYTISLNTATDEMTIEPYAEEPAVYSTMLISGTFNDWKETAMTPINTVASLEGHNHMWTCELDASAGPLEVKFLQHDWSPNWGSSDFPSGIGTDGGANIPVPEGVWTVIFNDIDGSYTFVAK